MELRGVKTEQQLTQVTTTTSIRRRRKSTREHSFVDLSLKIEQQFFFCFHYYYFELRNLLSQSVKQQQWERTRSLTHSLSLSRTNYRVSRLLRHVVTLVRPSICSTACLSVSGTKNLTLRSIYTFSRCFFADLLSFVCVSVRLIGKF